MRTFSSIFVFVVSLVFCKQVLFAQALEPIGGPYTADSKTVVLLHFDGDYTNAAATLGKTATSAIPHSTNLATKLSFLNQSGTLAGLGKSLRIDNSSINDSTYLTVADTAALDMTGNWTIEAWVNIFTFGSGSTDYRWVPRVVMKPGDDVFWHPNYWLEMWGDSRLFQAGFYTPDDKFITINTPINMFVPGEWVHLTFIRDTSRAFIAVMLHDVNKNLKGFLTQGFDKLKDIPKTNVQDLHIGWAGSKKIAAPSTDSWLDGFVDEIRISNVVRNFAGPPVIQSFIRLPNQPSTATSYPVEITVFPLNAGGSMSSVELKYRADTLSAFSSITLSSAGNNKYTGSIPAQAFGKLIQYYYVTKDNNNFTSLSPIDAESPNPSYYSFWVFQENALTLDLNFEQGPNGKPIDLSPNKATIKTFKDFKYSTDTPIGGGSYSLNVKATDGIKIDSNWVTASSPFLASEEFTLDSWLKPDSANRHAVRIIINPSAEQDWNNANFELSFRNGSSGLPVFTARYWRSDGSGAVTLQDTLVAQANHVGKWRHVIIERNKTNGNFAMVVRDENDKLLFKKTVNEMKSPIMANASLVIGRSWFLVDNQYYVGPYRGLIDNVKLYNYPASTITGVSEEPAVIPYEFKLSQNYPNPFNPSTVIEFTLPKYQRVSLVVYDILGRIVKTLVNEERHAGQHRVSWNSTNNLGSSVSSGVYFYELKTDDMRQVRKMMLLR